MQQPNLLSRSDTLFGVCQGIGEDFGISANLLRVGLAVGLFFSPVGTVAVYALLGATVAFSRWIAPRPAAAAPQLEQSAKLDAPADQMQELALAA